MELEKTRCWEWPRASSRALLTVLNLVGGCASRAHDESLLYLSFYFFHRTTTSKLPKPWSLSLPLTLRSTWTSTRRRRS